MNDAPDRRHRRTSLPRSARSRLAAGRRRRPTRLLMTDLGLDSLDCVEFVARVEEFYRLSVADDEWQELSDARPRSPTTFWLAPHP